MALPSQGGFSSVRRGSMYRRRRGRRGLSWLIVLVAALGITWMLWPESTTKEASDVAKVTIQTPKVETAKPMPIATPPVITQAPEPVIEPPKRTEHSVVETAKEESAPKQTPTLAKPIALAATTSANLEEGLDLLDSGQLVAARLQLSSLLRSGLLNDTEAAQARGVLTDISDTLVFSKEITPDDPFALEYIVRGGDTLSGIVQKMGLHVNWRFIQRINAIKQASGIRPGQNLKLITGPFHAKVDKSTYRIDLYQGDGNEQVFVRSYRVGLGEFNSTPTGLFKVRKNSKLVNPTWVNPRTREFYSADNPMNPIGERWIGLEGIEERTKDLSGLGIHGTIEPETIGTQASMGCIRMGSNDVSQVYEMLAEGISTVEIN
ncbi:MAG: L,D-transpeptidase family protein [Planctomycetes bacterium]|nr:L,D-transpeptidase family protein [Planctomycetota bacterium]